MWQYQNTDELYHYGVLGMKWGMRKAYNQGKDYDYKSWGQKKYQKKYEKLKSKLGNKSDISFRQQRKLDNTKNKLETYKGRDKNRVDYAKNTSVGKAVVKGILFGPLGSGNYNRFRASGSGRVASALGASIVGTILTQPVTALISKSSENKTGRARARAEGNIISKKDKITPSENTKNQKMNNLYKKHNADDIEGMLKNMSNKDLNKIPKNIMNGDPPEIMDYLTKNYKRFK